MLKSLFNWCFLIGKSLCGCIYYYFYFFTVVVHCYLEMGNT